MVSTVSQFAIDLVMEFEGCSLQAYPDPLSGGEPYTIGWGTTVYPDGRRVRPGETITKEDLITPLTPRPAV